MPVSFGHFQQLPYGTNAGIVDENVDGPEFCHQRIDALLDILFHRNVAGYADDLPPRFREGLSCLPTCLCILVENADVAAFGHEPLGNRASDAVGGTGHDRLTSFQSVHFSWPLGSLQS